jgi:hypothetical protein
MISQIAPLAVGNAVQISMQLPETAVHWRVLRNLTGAFPSFNDAGSFLIHEADGNDPLRFIDFGNLTNGTLYYYQGFYWDGAAWTTDDAPTSVTPSTTYTDESADALTLVTDRLTVGIIADIARGNLKPVAGKIEVLTAPPIYDDRRFPVVSVHLQSESPVNRGLGEEIANDEVDQFTELYDDHEGWVSKTQLQIVGWSLNPDERIALRKSIRGIIVANLAVFDEALLLQVEFSQQDVDELSTYPAPVYQTTGTFTCLAPIAVNVRRDPIASVDSIVIPLN